MGLPSSKIAEKSQTCNSNKTIKECITRVEPEILRPEANSKKVVSSNFNMHKKVVPN